MFRIKAGISCSFSEGVEVNNDTNARYLTHVASRRGRRRQFRNVQHLVGVDAEELAIEPEAADRDGRGGSLAAWSATGMQRYLAVVVRCVVQVQTDKPMQLVVLRFKK